MEKQNYKVGVTYGNKDLKEICSEILQQEFTKLLNKENKGVEIEK